MTRYRVEFDGVITDDDDDQKIVKDPEVVQGIVDRILLELTKLASMNPQVAGQPDDGGLTVSVDIEESEMFMASLAGFTQIRTAVHAADIGTPGWKVEWVRTTTVAPGRRLSEGVPA